ncbi:thiamine ABC transporter substrate-binding protein [Halocalculus aciditolerans]|uniref:Thiamine-binding protein n=1 Tax=Halocalculus aciditolerans TaxID=1383812 RepID=A0A830F3C9_9EURY|nr:thiamine ABC transporter substrate-binding protein [Halocalculus aciditolerans]GGL51114.1 thiamine-binding protein [Halocalculus aciditolerans]
MSDDAPRRSPSRTRRAYLAGTGAAAVAALAGCSGGGGDTTTATDTTGTTTGGTTSTAQGSRTLRVGAGESYVNAVSTSAGDWVKQEFEKRHDDVTLEWVVRDGEINDFIQRRDQGAPLGADAYVGVTPTDLVRAERVLGDDTALFTPLDSIDTSTVVDDYWFDAQKRVVPTGASHVCIVYDATQIEEPKTFDDLLADQYEGGLLLANPQTTVTGLDFLLWTVHTKGEDHYLDYWKQLMDNGAHVLKSWNASYSAYGSGEAPMVVSYSTDQIYAANSDSDLDKHRIAFPNDQGYAYIGGVGKFATTEQGGLVDEFASFLLQPDVQQRTAVLNVGVPSVENASLPEEYQQYAKRPAETVQYDVATLREHADDWRSAWARQVASN